MAYNLPELKSLDKKLQLTQGQIVGIYNGTIQWWDDPSIFESNGDITLPHQRIKVFARSDSSGTTEIFTSALTAFSTEWAETYGTFSSGVDTTTDIHPIWNESAIFKYGYKNPGMTGLILSFKYSIGYVSVADAVNAKMEYALLENAQGKFISPSTIAVQNAMDDFASSPSDDLTMSLSNPSGEESYPISGYTYFIVRMKTMTNCVSAVELVRYADWFLTDTEPRTACERSSMVPLSSQMADKVRSKVLKTITCVGQNVWQMALDQKQEEELSLQTWRLPVMIAAPTIGFLIICLVAYLGFQRYKISKILDGDAWKINIEDIIFYYVSKTNREHRNVRGGTLNGSSLGKQSKQSSSLEEEIPVTKVGIARDLDTISPTQSILI